MVKTRVILAILAVVLSSAIYMVSASQMGSWRYVLYVTCGILLLASLNVLTFSFMRVDESPSGELCFKKNNPLWCVILMFNEDAEWGRISLCKAYWTVVFAQIVAMIILGVIAMCVGTIIMIIVKDGVLHLLMMVGIAIAILLLFWGGVAGAIKVSYSMTPAAKKKAGKYVGGSVVVLLWAFLLGVVVLLFVVSANKLGISVWMLLLYCLGAVAALAAIIALVRFAFIKLPELRNTPMGKVMGSAKDTLCPTLVSCDYQD